MKLALLSCCIFASIQSVCSPAFADPDANAEALAESLYREGKRLMTEGQASAACPKFAESFRLSPATGTQLNLAACYQQSGKWASAWTAYQAAVAAAARDGRQDRVTYAQEKIAEIEPMLSYVTLHLIQEEHPKGLEVSIDGAKLSVQALDIPLPVDPGSHLVVARADGYQTWESTLNVNEEKARLTLEIPALTPVPSKPVATVTEFSPVKKKEPSTLPQEVKLDNGTSRPIPPAVYIGGGITLAAGIGAIVSGALYFSESGKAESASSRNDKEDYITHRDHAQTMSHLNLGLDIAFGLGVMATTLLYLMRPDSNEFSAKHATTGGSYAHISPFFTPWVNQQGAGLSFTFRGDFVSSATGQLP